MIDTSLTDKLSRLKSIFSGNDVDEGAKKQIAEWESRIQTLSKSQDFFNNEVSQMIYKSVKDRIKSHILFRIGKGRTPDELRISDAKEEECRWLLGLFNSDYQKELESLDEIISAEL